MHFRGISVLLGAGIYPAGALLNHSCDGNCVMQYSEPGHVQNVRCLRDVSKVGWIFLHAAIVSISLSLSLSLYLSLIISLFSLSLSSSSSSSSSSVSFFFFCNLIPHLMVFKCTFSISSPTRAKNCATRMLTMLRLPQPDVRIFRIYTALYVTAQDVTRPGKGPMCSMLAWRGFWWTGKVVCREEIDFSLSLSLSLSLSPSLRKNNLACTVSLHDEDS